MNMTQELDEAIAYLNKNREDIQANHAELVEEQYQDQSKIKECYTNFIDIIQKIIPLLTHLKEECEEVRHKIQHYDEVIDLNNYQTTINQEQIAKLNQTIRHMQLQEQQSRSQIHQLQQDCAERELQIQQKQQKTLETMQQLREQNANLNQYLDNLQLKYKNLLLIVNEENTRRQYYQHQNQKYQHHQEELTSIIQQMKTKIILYEQEKSQLLQFKQPTINQQMDHQTHQQSQNDQVYPNEQHLMQDGLFDGLSTDLKLVMLSEQLNFQQKPLYYLDTFRSSRQMQQSSLQKHDSTEAHHLRASAGKHFTFQEVISKQTQSRESLLNYGSMRKVASTIQLTGRRRANTKHILNAQSYNKQQKISDSQAIISINQRVEQRLLTLQKQTDSNKIIMETLNTQGQSDMSMIQEESKQQQKQQSPDKTQKHKIQLKDLDPYYIHYLLTVQSVKIEEDEDGIYGILEIDMNPYYRELIDSKVSISKWGDWIRQKILVLHQQTQILE